LHLAHLTGTLVARQARAVHHTQGSSLQIDFRRRLMREMQDLVGILREMQDLVGILREMQDLVGILRAMQAPDR
jgi:hypothetical protein